MKLAITYDKSNNQIWQHFGKTEYFRIVNIESGRAVGDTIIATDGAGHEALAGFLKDQGVEALICGGIGGGARNALAEAGIALYGGVFGDADDAIVSFVTGNLQYSTEPTCDHHEHGESHDCGSQHSHSCGGHSRSSLLKRR